MIPAISIVLAIAGGQPIDLPAAVVVEGAELMCTGSRIAEGVVLTAAHCLEQEGPFVVDGAEAEVRGHPDWTPSRPGELDVALLYGDWDGPLLELGEVPAVGDPARHVGYGLQEGDVEPVLRVAEAEVANVFARILATSELDGGPCHGDSGGPVLDDEGRLVAVTSFTPDCEADVNGSARVDVVLDWIEDSIAAGPPEVSEPPPDEVEPTDCQGCALLFPALPLLRGRRRRPRRQ